MSLTDKTEGQNQPALLIEGLEFQYASAQKPVLKIANFSLQKSEKLFLHGPSGSGKSTLLEIIAGIQVPQKGRIQFQGKDLTKITAGERDQLRADSMGYIFQSFNLLPFLSVRENILLGLRFSKTKKVAKGELEHLVDRLGLSKQLEQKAGHLSVGQAQRVAAARAVLGKPALMIADEPTSSLDVDHRERFMNVLFELAKEAGQSMLFVSHDISLASGFDRKLSLPDINQAGGPA